MKPDMTGKPSVEHQKERQTLPTDETVQVRFRIGLAAIFCLVAGFLMLPFGRFDAFSAALIRVGILAGTAWLAFPTLKRARWRPRNRIESWLLTLTATLVAVRPKIFIPIALVAVVLLLFKIPGTGGNESDRQS